MLPGPGMTPEGRAAGRRIIVIALVSTAIGLAVAVLTTWWLGFAVVVLPGVGYGFWWQRKHGPLR